MPEFQVGNRVRFVEPNSHQIHMLNWEGEILDARHGSSTVTVRLHAPENPQRRHTESYFPRRLVIISPYGQYSPIEYVMRKLQKRQKFYQDNKSQLPTWYAAYGD